MPGRCASVTGWAAALPPSCKTVWVYFVHSYPYLLVYIKKYVKKFSIAFRSFWFDPENVIPHGFFNVCLTYSEVRVAMSYVVALGARA